MTLTLKPNIAHLRDAGDYCFTTGDPKQVIMACPVCAGRLRLFASDNPGSATNIIAFSG